MSDTPTLTDPLHSADPDLTGRKLGDYRLLRRLGRGGMGEVYLAEQESLRRQAAVKVLRLTLAVDASYVQRFMYEARAAARLTHANIVQMYEVGQTDGIHYIAQEYVPGQNLRQLLARRGRPLEINQAIGVIRQVAVALHKASEQGIVHRDIKPENILLTPEGEVKVADFGLARVTNDAETLHLTQLGMTMGSPLYMSPEQAEGRSVDPRSDLYSFGATCYHLLTGRPPFTGETPLSIAVQHVRNEPTPIVELRPDVPTGLARIVHRLLAKRPQDRFTSAVEVLKELRSLRGEVSDEVLEGLDAWSTPEIIALSDARHGATQRLDQLLKTQAMHAQPRRNWWIWPATLGLGLLVGFLVANAMKPKPLLQATATTRPEVPKQETVTGQLFFAELTNTEPAWKAVAQYFPPVAAEANLQAARKAEKGLADFYLQDGRLDDAAAIYTNLTNLGPVEIQLRMQGHAGLVIIYYVTSQDDAAREELARVLEYRQLLDEETRAEIVKISEKLGSDREAMRE